MKTLFYGTPTVAVPFLRLLAERRSAGFELAGVVSQPDKAAGRALKVEPTPVKREALRLGLPVLQPERPSAAVAELKALKPDLAVAVAYGKLLKADVLSIPSLGTLNVHFSLLPKYRGAAPVQWALVRGETRTGVTVFWLDEGMDTGPILAQEGLDISPEDDAPALMDRLATLGLKVLSRALDEVAAGHARREPQKGEPSLAPLIRKEDARLRLERPAKELHDLVRGMRLWPRAYLELAGPKAGRLLVLKTRLEAGVAAGAGSSPARPGAVVRVERDGGILVQCGDDSRLWLLAVQPEGKNPITAADFLNGLRLGAGALLPVVSAS